MDATQKRHLRAIVRRVHPDLFMNHPVEAARNSESLGVLERFLLLAGDLSEIAISLTDLPRVCSC